MSLVTRLIPPVRLALARPLLLACRPQLSSRRLTGPTPRIPFGGSTSRNLCPRHSPRFLRRYSQRGELPLPFSFLLNKHTECGVLGEVECSIMQDTLQYSARSTSPFVRHITYAFPSRPPGICGMQLLIRIRFLLRRHTGRQGQSARGSNSFRGNHRSSSATTARRPAQSGP